MDRILIALDTPQPAAALALADTLRGSVGGFKIGSQLFTAAGPEIVRTLVARGDRVFLDLKFHDIPNTVAGAVAAATELGVWMLNVHASGGPEMLEAARDAASQTAARLGRPRPLVIAVTVLTSLDQTQLQSIGVTASPLDHVLRLGKLVQAAGLDGVVASPQETAALRQACGKDFVIVTPGIRGGAAASKADDQRRTMDPASAVQAGSSYLVVGRPITGAPDPREAARRVAADLSATSR
ncbi:MAG TPA: orotidine-5'-phosphate decarboxylase [Vicinamibacterales bacterium]|nr:orotidine-5'-phosphate decarboxylase [Vicinamibacterales bacterium]